MYKQIRKGFSISFNEIQRVPQLLSYIQVIVDERKDKGDFIITGSHQSLLSQAITQSLSGRTGIARLYPLSQGELVRYTKIQDPFTTIQQGFYPAIYAENIPLALFYPNYYLTYLEREVGEIIHLRNTREFQIFCKLVAGRTGQLVNYSAIASDTGVSQATI